MLGSKYNLWYQINVYISVTIPLGLLGIYVGLHDYQNIKCLEWTKIVGALPYRGGLLVKNIQKIQVG